MVYVFEGGGEQETILQHPGFGKQVPKVFLGDLEVLVDRGFIIMRARSASAFEMDILPEGYVYVADMRPSTQPIVGADSSPLKQRPRPRDVQRQIEQFLFSQSTNDLQPHTMIAERLGLEADYTRDNIEVLRQRGRVRTQATFSIVYAALTAQARLDLEEEVAIAAGARETERQAITATLTQARRALHALERRAATFGGAHLPVHIELDLEDKRAEVAELEQRLAGLDT